jgi:hypothetical protein
MNDSVNIPAIHDDDLKSLLIKHGLYDRVIQGKILCYISNEVITWDNIYGLLEVNGELKLVCDNSECIDKLNNAT